MKNLFLAFILISAFPLYAAKNYVRGIQKVTFRTGAGTDSKIIKMMDADSAVTILDVEDEWSEVKDKEGNTGYILSRFLTTDIPFSLKFKWLKKKYDKMKEENKNLKQVNLELENKTKETETKLQDNIEKLTVANTSYEALKEGSADFLKVQSNYNKANKQLENQTNKMQGLEKQLSKHYIYWFLAGAGVLFLGWVLGVAFRKRKGGTGLSF